MTCQWLNSWDEVSKKIWEKICKLNPPNLESREIFELLASAFIYDLNAVQEFGEDHIHEAIGVSRFASSQFRHREFFDVSQHPYLFCHPPNVRGKEEYFGSMHMASASFRISTALCLTDRVGYALPEIKQLIRTASTDWNRDLLAEYLDRPQKDVCDASHVITMKDLHTQEDIRLYLAMVVACRDEFGHGEIGDGGRWRKERGVMFPHYLRCQLIEAHINLIGMVLKVY